MKTIEEAAKESSKNSRIPLTQQGRYIYEDGFIDGVKFAQRWISVEEELPEIKDESYQIIVCTQQTISGNITFRTIAIFSFESEMALKSKLKQYTHWRPIELK